MDFCNRQVPKGSKEGQTLPVEIEKDDCSSIFGDTKNITRAAETCSGVYPSCNVHTHTRRTYVCIQHARRGMPVQIVMAPLSLERVVRQPTLPVLYDDAANGHYSAHRVTWFMIPPAPSGPPALLDRQCCKEDYLVLHPAIGPRCMDGGFSITLYRVLVSTAAFCFVIMAAAARCCTAFCVRIYYVPGMLMYEHLVPSCPGR